MSELLDYYCEQARAKQSDSAWLAALQKQAVEDFYQQGFPKRTDEEWKYTRVDDIARHQFALPEAAATATTPPKSESPLSHVISLVNGSVIDIETVSSLLPDGVILLSLADAVRNHGDLIKTYLNQSQSHHHGFQALNTAMLHTGIFLYVPKGVSLPEPILLSHWQDKPEQAVHIRHIIIAEENSRASVVESYSGPEQCPYFNNVVTEIFIHPRASVTHYKIQREGRSAYHIGHTSVQQEKDSSFQSHSLSLGGSLVRSDLHVQLLQEGADCLMNGIYAPEEGQHIDHHTRVDHNVPDCSSQQDYKGILSGHSRAVFNGKVIVAKDAQHTVAKQQNKNLLLSEQAEIDTKPQLEIDADDVVCTHGATVGQLDENALFYLAARGISREEASAFLIKAFAAENIALIDNSALAEWMGDLLNQQLGGQNG